MKVPEMARQRIKATRPTARDLFYAVDRVYEAAAGSVQAAVDEAIRLARLNTEAAKISENMVSH